MPSTDCKCNTCGEPWYVCLCAGVPTYRIINADGYIVWQGTDFLAANRKAYAVEQSEGGEIECRSVSDCGHYGHSRFDFRKDLSDYCYGNVIEQPYDSPFRTI